MDHTNSTKLFDRAQKLTPGGVNSPVRAFKSVGGTPVFMERGEGAYIYDVDGNRYLDFVMSWGPHLFGHRFAPVIEALRSALEGGTSFGAPTGREVELAELITQMIPSVEMVRLVNSGTEATMSAVRLARAATGREKLIKFAGCYHGHADSFLISAGSGALTLGAPDSPGVTTGTAKDTLLAEYNDLLSVEKLLHANSGQVAAIIVEPVVGNMGCLKPRDGFLAGLRQLCDKSGALLIFDEVMTGFRLARGGAQELYGITPDITTLGKIVGGGLPLAAYGGKRSVMEHVAPLGKMYQAGTLSGNPLAVAAGIAMLQSINQDKNIYTKLESLGARLEMGLTKAFEDRNMRAKIARVGSMLTVFFADVVPHDYASAKNGADTKQYSEFFHSVLENGVYLPPSQFEAMFISLAHTDARIDDFIGVVKGK